MRGGGSADFFAGKYAGDVGCRQQNEAAAEGCEGEGKGGGEQRRKVGLRQQRKWQGIAKKCRPAVSELRLWRRKLKYQLQAILEGREIMNVEALHMESHMLRVGLAAQLICEGREWKKNYGLKLDSDDAEYFLYFGGSDVPMIEWKY
ncbi:uncharacterized protein A4U43_C08F19330 [Asparagus officinalis]|nr:uncharacterized protein A4U43_C08F19330 [Asparagus officinalis]